MKAIFSKLLLFALIWLTIDACSPRDEWEDIPPQNIPTKLEGFWESEGYGFVLSIRNGEATVYDVTSTTCLQMRRDHYLIEQGKSVAKWKVRIHTNGNEFRYISTGYTAEILFKRLQKLPYKCEANLIQPTTDAQQNFDVLWQTFQEHYAFFKLRGVDWNKILAHYRPLVTEQNLFEVFSEMLAPFQEDHVNLTTSDGRFFEAGQGPLLVSKFYNDYLTDKPGGSFEEYIHKNMVN
ncbi:hypothetical protein ACS5NO_28415 [Larkinella sp. GY13]|uniref:hypothetical protein n=1 Tax=Larkinella sp. GY13 TaxID=3453720 RepID=UPI003EEFCA73